jgi:acyl-CoA dehydrogenase
MEFLCWLATFLVVFLALAYWQTPRPLASALFAGAIVVWQVWQGPSVFLAALLWLVFLAVAIPLNVTSLRRRVISDPIRRIFRRVLPTMSSTEREALEAGTVWWEGELFSGRPDWRKLLELPSPGLSAEERAYLDGPVEELCRLADDWRITEELHDLPPEVWQYIRENGFFGMIIPKEYGGLGFSALAHSCVVMKIATRSTTVAVTVMVPNSLGPAELLLHYGTDAQKQYYLPRLARGEEIPCFALTGPEAGSDASAIPDRGVLCRGEFE